MKQKTGLVRSLFFSYTNTSSGRNTTEHALNDEVANDGVSMWAWLATRTK